MGMPSKYPRSDKTLVVENVEQRGKKLLCKNKRRCYIHKNSSCIYLSIKKQKAIGLVFKMGQREGSMCLRKAVFQTILSYLF
jgi:hypothetical protein